MTDKNEFFIRAKSSDGQEHEVETHTLRHALDHFHYYCRVYSIVEMWKMKPDGQNGECVAAYHDNGIGISGTGEFSTEPGW